MKHLVLPLLLMAGLAGCASGDVILEAPEAGYVEDVPAALAGVDWSAAQSVTVELSAYRFAPSTLVFEAGTPTRLVLRNTGNGVHTFVSEGFFKAIAAEKLVSGDDVVALPYLKTIEVPAQTQKELHFVAVRQGSYPLECSVLLHDSFGMVGNITVR